MPAKSRAVCFVVLPLLAATLAVADDPRVGIDRCAALPSEEARIACLESLVREMAGTAAPAAEAVGAGAAAAATAPPESTPADVAGSSPERVPADVAGSPREEAVDPVSASEPTTSGERVLPELGAEQVAVRQPDEEEPKVQAMVIRHREVGYQKLQVELDNGQIWQQTEGDRLRVIRRLRDADQFVVELWGTKSGGYRLRIPSEEITLRVRRIR